MQNTGSNDAPALVIGEWLDRMRALIRSLYTVDWGYPLGENFIRNVNAEQSLVQKLFGSDIRLHHLVTYYQLSDGLELPDVRNGLFIHRVDMIHRGILAGEPTEISGPGGGTVITFGSDGGGGRYAVRTGGEPEVLHLPVGRVKDSVFDGKRYPIRVLAQDFCGFLRIVEEDTSAFISLVRNWQYRLA